MNEKIRPYLIEAKYCAEMYDYYSNHGEEELKNKKLYLLNSMLDKAMKVGQAL